MYIVNLKTYMIQDAGVGIVLAQRVESSPPPNVFASPEVFITAAVLLLEYHGLWYYY